MSDETRLKIVRWVCISVLLFGLFIWPTPFKVERNSHGTGNFVTFRLTGHSWYIHRWSW